jgi:hypothetical protein
MEDWGNPIPENPQEEGILNLTLYSIFPVFQ